jgi:hypothetical protein
MNLANQDLMPLNPRRMEPIVGRALRSCQMETPGTGQEEGIPTSVPCDGFARWYRGFTQMAVNFPVLTPRGALSVALKQVWPGDFKIKRQRHGFGITLAHSALNSPVTMAIDDDLVGNAEIVARYVTRTAWACFLLIGPVPGSTRSDATRATARSPQRGSNESKIEQVASKHPS